MESHDDYTVVKSALDALPGLVAVEKPWCLYVGTFGPHDDFVVPQHYVDMYDSDAIPLPANYHDTMHDKPAVYRRMRDVLVTIQRRGSPRLSAPLLGVLHDGRRVVRSAVGQAGRTGQKENTLVLFVSDHGEYCGSHGLYCKGIPSGGLSCACHHALPQQHRQSLRVEDAFVSLADFAPTFLELAGAQTPERLTGRSLTPFLQGDQPIDWR